MAKPKAGFDTNPQNINKKGRPKKGHSITETIREMMTEKPEIKRALSTKILDMAMKGDITAMKTIWQYMDGMPVQPSTEDPDKLKDFLRTYRPKRDEK